MNIADLAEELGVAPSEVLQAARAQGIAASWAGVDLDAGDEALLRTMFVTNGDGPGPGLGPDAQDAATPAAEDPSPIDDPGPAGDDVAPTEAIPAVVDATAALPTVAPGPTAVPTVAPDAVAPLPPNVVASLDDPDELIPHEDHEVRPGGPLAHAGDDAPDGASNPATVAPVSRDIDVARFAPDAIPQQAAVTSVTPPPVRRIDPAVRRGVIAVVVAVAAAFGANGVVGHSSAVGLLLMVVVTIALLVTALAGNSARYRITTHPERFKGLIVGVALLLVGVLGLVGIGVATWFTLRTAPPGDGVVARIGRTHVVHDLRWSRE
ncbi:MAG TPA: hypothetical protein VGM93_08225, partial [Acidimicrobiales bacterium]